MTSPAPYRHRPAGIWSRAASTLTGIGTGLLAAGTRLGRFRCTATTAGALATVVGALAERWAVLRAGDESADNPLYTVDPQRARASRHSN